MTDTNSDATEESSDDQHLTFDRGVDLVDHPREDGAIAAAVTTIRPGTETNSVSVNRGDLVRGIDTDLRDSYPTVFFWCDGETLALTDHEQPADGADVDHLANAKPHVDVKRVEAIKTTDYATVALIDRDAATTAIADLTADRVIVHVEDGRPVVIEGEHGGVAIAPRSKPGVPREVTA